MSKNGTLICIAGNIGVGKTSLTQILSDALGYHAYYENFQDNPFLQPFYTDMQRWAYHSQMFFLSERLRQATEFAKHKNIVSDRSIYEDAGVFAYTLYQEKLLNEDEWQLYTRYYESIKAQSRVPDLLIYLNAPVSTLQARILMRGRGFEKVTESYLVQLNNRYHEWFQEYDLSDKVIINTDNVDFVHNMSDQKNIIEQCRPKRK